MFSGLVEEVGALVAVLPTGQGARLRIAASEAAADMAVGDSMTVDGACLTAVAIEPPHVAMEAVAETLRRTTLGLRRPGHRVNLERALRVGDRLGGHIVQGHVDGMADVLDAWHEGDSVVLRVGTPADLLPYVVEKGSVALDGVSLTVASVLPDAFTVALIPHTMAVTTLGPGRVGDRVNIEVDALAKYVEMLVIHHLRNRP